MTQYRLLRNNKETGPYTREQLLQMGVKAYDLIWADGKTNAWQYPSEINELKAYAPVVEEQPFDRFYKKPAARQSSISNTSTETLVEVYPAIKEKPRYRVAADWQKVEQVKTSPQIVKPVPAVETQNTPASSRQNIYMEWKQEKPVRQQEKEPVLETKFSQSLNDIKERYVETVLRKKESYFSGINKQNLVTAAMLIPILAIGCWFIFGTTDHKKPENNSPIAAENKTVAAPPKLDLGDDPAAQNNPSANEPVATVNSLPQEVNKDGASTLPASNKPADKSNTQLSQAIKAKTTVPAIKVINTNLIKTTIATSKPTGTMQVIKTVSTGNETAKTSIATNTPGNTVTDKAPVTVAPKIDDYIRVKGDRTTSTKEIQNLKLSVENVTDFSIDLAVLDIQYFDAAGHYQKGETVYVNKIPANQTIQVKIPDSKTSGSVRYKVSLISSEQKSLYMIAD